MKILPSAICSFPLSLRVETSSIKLSQTIKGDVCAKLRALNFAVLARVYLLPFTVSTVPLIIARALRWPFTVKLPDGFEYFVDGLRDCG